MNVKLIAISTGSLEQAKRFLEATKFNGELYLDQNKFIYRALGLNHGILKTVTLSGIAASFQAYRKGYTVTASTSTGDPWQLGGFIVIGPHDSKILFKHVAQTSHDHPNIDEILAACKQ